jgi:hypothetical protein
MSEQWVPMSEASYQLRSEGFEISASKLSRMARSGEIKYETDPVDKRIRLVDLNYLRELFASSKRYKK